ncbi:L,D-peptidoglycan transpeptidase YkuD (ErfK/YbiS/YcfS/YnhG family) [Methylorubrum rhodinum]|jgi:L,D-peptidoglycan transpeptidase YkuD (ErfK/YbiS/YcfS/YnhG family)|uniref:L,D-peptidoglycan transpeptidase YkuD (ErfK/YbiS/YcfS/YnhG family) n=1 Tax=Methylorubrum rhodinum TaxID=29428 RepID=A0A840ZFQ4_9HYPH|nr:L,D-transpeptidase family protein [Methylorubrum rhodinum]MBB5755851.1 L,D-peptidoglycan transpeptidase YkuD (ErfK/YbiS/YcfS/YnhG family) [Methylorubrum rhodinum]
MRRAGSGAAVRPATLALLRVHPLPGDPTGGRLVAGAGVIPCALGRSGLRAVKREGDGASPRGVFRLRGGFFRPDRFPVRPATPLPLRAIRPDDGWCDAAGDRRYNRPIRLPSPTSAEAMWRDDGLYDLVLDLDHNRGPIRPGAGSAIFMHIARAGFRPTEGCVALRPADLRRLLRRLGPSTRIAIGPVPARPKRGKGS